MLTADEEDNQSSSDVLTLVTQAVDHLSRVVGDPKFRYNQNHKLVSAVDGAWAAMKAAQMVEGRNQSMLSTLSEINTKLEKIEKRQALRTIAKKLTNVTKHSDPIPGIH